MSPLLQTSPPPFSTLILAHTSASFTSHYVNRLAHNEPAGPTACMRTHARNASRASCRACPLSSPPSGQPEPTVTRALASHGGTQQRAGPKASTYEGQRPSSAGRLADRAAASSVLAQAPLVPPAPATLKWIFIILPQGSIASSSEATDVVRSAPAQHPPSRSRRGPPGGPLRRQPA